jgi:hypothetical protein
METLHVPFTYLVVAIAILGVSVEHAAADNAVSNSYTLFVVSS